MADHHENALESESCAHLKSHGGRSSPNDAGYDRERALFPGRGSAQ